MMAKNASTNEDAEKYLKIAVILNIIGIISIILVTVTGVLLGLRSGSV